MFDFLLAIHQHVLDYKVNDLSLLILTSWHTNIIVNAVINRWQKGQTLSKKIILMIFRLSVGV